MSEKTLDESSVDLSGNLDYSDSIGARSGKSMAITLSNVSIRDWVQKRREGLQPWTEFANYTRFKMPQSITPLGRRVVANIDRFQSNYVLIFLALVIFCIMTSPLLLIAMGVCLGACYLIKLRNKESQIKVLGHEISLAHQYTAVAAMSFPLFWIAGAGGIVFWIIGASFFVIMLHASLYTLDTEMIVEPEVLQMETV